MAARNPRNAALEAPVLIAVFFRIAAKVRRIRVAAMSALHARRFASCGPDALIREPQSMVGCEYVHVGRGFDVFPGLRLEVFDRHLQKRFAPTMRIGDRVSINYDCHIGCVNRIEIGDDVLIASRVYISDHSHGAPDFSDTSVPPSVRPVHSKGPVVIESEVWIGEGACVLPGVHIGRGAIIGANAVVSRDVPAFCVAAGVPARVIRVLPTGCASIDIRVETARIGSK